MHGKAKKEGKWSGCVWLKQNKGMKEPRHLGPPDASIYHLLQNIYSFDALQAYCCGINLKLQRL